MDSRVTRGESVGGGTKDQLEELIILLSPGAVADFQVSGGPFVMRGHGGSVSVLVWASPSAPVMMVTYGGISRLYDGWKKPVVSLMEILTFQEFIDATVNGGD